jgi:hypothetical protein
VLSSDILTAVGDFAALIAAGAALKTVSYARATLKEQRDADKEAREANAKAQKAREDTVFHQMALVATTEEAHQREMVERKVAYDRDLVLQRHGALARVIDILGEISDIARREVHNPAPRMGPGVPGRWSPLPGMLIRLEVACSVLVSLGGPTLDTAIEMAQQDRNLSTRPHDVVRHAIDAMTEIDSLVRNEANLALPKPEV